jgi:hypothetical protein
VPAVGAAATTVLLGPSATVGAAEPTFAEVPSDSQAVSQPAAPTTSPAPSTSPASTVASTTTESPAETAAQSWQGTYHVVSTVTTGNDNIPAGTTNEFDATFISRCKSGDCTVRSPEFFNATWRGGASRLTLRTTITEPCPNKPQVSITDVVRITLLVSGRDADGIPTRITGTQTTSAPQAARCGEGSVNQPVTYTYSFSRAS